MRGLEFTCGDRKNFGGMRNRDEMSAFGDFMPDRSRHLLANRSVHRLGDQGVRGALPQVDRPTDGGDVEGPPLVQQPRVAHQAIGPLSETLLRGLRDGLQHLFVGEYRAIGRTARLHQGLRRKLGRLRPGGSRSRLFGRRSRAASWSAGAVRLFDVLLDDGPGCAAAGDGEVGR